MNAKTNLPKKYQYRGCSYQKNATYKYPINISEYQQNRSCQESSSTTLSYRGASYSPTKVAYPVDFGLSVYIQKYRGVEYLTCLTNLHVEDKEYKTFSKNM